MNRADNQIVSLRIEKTKRIVWLRSKDKWDAVVPVKGNGDSA